MKDIPEYEKDLASIRNMMERSSKVLSLSGLSGVMAGVYAIVGAAVAYYMLFYPAPFLEISTQSLIHPEILWRLVAIATIILFLSIATVLRLSNSKAKRNGVSLWNPAGQQMVINLVIPLITGGLFILVLLFNGHVDLIVPACLIFYGVGLIHGSSNTVDEVRYLGFLEIGLGLTAALYPAYGFIFWVVGFGLLHIIYGAIMYNKYDK